MGNIIIAEPTGGAGEAVGANKRITVQDKDSRERQAGGRQTGGGLK